MNKRRTFVDLFCGCGGWTEGLKKAGWTPLLGVDIDRTALNTYEINHPGVGTLQCDVTQLKASQLPRKVDLIVASPPCQTFSYMGKRADSVADDLCHHVARIASLTSAQHVMLENVSGILTKGNTFARLITSLKRKGYHVQHAKVNAADYGVPQRRRRVILIASMRGLPILSMPSSPHILMPRVLLRPDQVPSGYWLKPDRIASLRSKISDGYVRFIPHDRQAVAPTIIASYAAASAQSALIEYSPQRVRALTEQECARLQSFPSKYQWCGTQRDVYRQIGNAVPPRLAWRLGEWLASVLE